MSIKEYAKEMIERDQVFRDIAEQTETLWINDKLLPFEMTDALCQLVVTDEDIEDTERRLQKFAPYIKKCFPETREDDGLIESPLADIPEMQKALEEKYDADIPGRFMLKMDSHLPIAGSVKARGGIYEVLKHAEDLALEAGLITEDDNYERFADDDMKEFFGKHTVQVGSTGNLGLSIGIMSAFLGFKVKVHMSADARQWKKDMLRSKGVDVIEYEEDYSKAVSEGRRLSDLDPTSYFVDDEYSLPLFLGYAVAAGRMKKQLEEKGVTVDKDHPMIIYVPCGVGGAPGGVCYGFKRLFKLRIQAPLQGRRAHLLLRADAVPFGAARNGFRQIQRGERKRFRTHRNVGCRRTCMCQPIGTGHKDLPQPAVRRLHGARCDTLRLHENAEGDRGHLH